MLILNEQNLRQLLSMSEVIAAVERGFQALARGEVTVPERLRLEVRNGVLLEMPAHAVGSAGRAPGRPEELAGSLGTKIVSVFHENPSRGMPLVQSVYLLLDSETGAALALMDGRYITAIRTAATSAVATRRMANPVCKTLAVFGAGVQAAFHIEAMIEVSALERVLIASRSPERAAELAARSESRYGIATECATAEQAVSQAELICTCTTAGDPLFDGRLVRPGTHINAVGAFTPATRELDTELVRRARVIIDAELAAGREAGELLIPLSEGAIEPAHIKGELSDVVSGKIRGRESATEITLFKSCGLALEDLVTAQLAYERAAAEGIGTPVDL